MEFRNRPSKPRRRLPAPYEQLRAVRSNEEHGEYNNRVSAIFATLRTAAPTVLKSLDDGARSPPG